MAKTTFPPITIDPKSDPVTPAYRVKVPAALEHNVFNDNTMLGLSAGSATALAVGVLSGGATMVGGVALAGFGALVGNWVDEKKFKDSQQNGIEVKPAGFLNKGLFSGMLTGFSAGSFMLAARALAPHLPGFLSEAATFLGGAGLTAGVIVPIVALGIAAVIGTMGAINYMKESRHQYQSVENQFQEQTQRIHTMERALLKARAAGIETPPLLAERDPELQFTAYAHAPDTWHPANDRAPDAQKFIDNQRAPAYLRQIPDTGTATAVAAAAMEPATVATVADALDAKTLLEKYRAARANDDNVTQRAV